MKYCGVSNATQTEVTFDCFKKEERSMYQLLQCNLRDYLILYVPLQSLRSVENNLLQAVCDACLFEVIFRCHSLALELLPH